MRIFGFEIKRYNSAFSVGESNSETVGYEAGSTSKRVSKWNPTDASASALTSMSASLIRSRARSTVRNNSYAKKGALTIVSNMVGKGIRPQLHTKNLAFKQELLLLWNKWVKECDVENNCDFYGLQGLACNSMVVAGEAFGRFRYRKASDNLSVPLQIQLIEPDQLQTSLNMQKTNGEVICDGIEYDSFGRKKLYHFYKTPPNNLIGSSAETILVPAKEVFHLFRPERIGQNRGVSWLSTILLKLKDLDEYEDAELIRKKTAALFAAFITKTGEDEASNPLPNVEPDYDEDGIGSLSMEPGTIQLLAPGEDIKFSEPADLGDSYKEFLRSQLLNISAGMGVLYEQLTGDLRSVNYSSIRQGLVEFRRLIETYQQNLIVFQMCIPTWHQFFNTAVLSNAIKLPKDYFSDPNYLIVNWIGQGFDWVDPLKDVQADKVAVEAGFKARQDVVSEYGGDINSLHEKVETENNEADSKGLSFSSDGRYTVGTLAQGNQKEDKELAPETDNKIIENIEKKRKK